MVVSQSAYYRYLKSKNSKKEVLKNKLLIKIRAIAKESHKSYGERQIAKHL